MVAVACAGAYVLLRWRPRASASVVLGVVWAQLVMSLAISPGPVPALIVFPALVIGAGLLLGERAAVALAIASALAIPAGFFAGKVRLTGGWAPSGQEVAWLVVAVICTLGLAAISRAALSSYRQLLLESDAARRRYVQLFDVAPDGLVELDPSDRVAEANPAAHALLLPAGGELVGKPIAEVLRAPVLAAPPDLAHARPGTLVVVELPDAAGPARVLEISVGAASSLERNGRRLIVIRDVTARRLAEERLGHAQRLETVGQLAGGVAHDFNNLLTVIGGNAAELARSPDAEARELAAEIVEAHERGKGLTRQLLAFARREVRRPAPLDLRSVVEDIRRLLERLLGERHRLAVRGSGPVPVFADRGQLEQVAINLIGNARDAMAGGGEVEVRVERLDRGAAGRLGSELDADEQAMLEVIDSGVGMTAETRERIFQPFFTMKPRGQGTGLGLATVHGIVAQSGGQIAVESAPGRGSRFRVFLPLGSAAEVAAAPAGERRGPASGQGRVLLVEDDPAVAGLALRVLRGAGYRVMAAPNAEEARALFAVEAPFDLLVTDLMLPGASGAELARSLLARAPELRVLFVSGYFDERVDGLAPLGALLPKPFSPQELLERVRRVLDAPAARGRAAT